VLTRVRMRARRDRILFFALLCLLLGAGSGAPPAAARSGGKRVAGKRVAGKRVAGPPVERAAGGTRRFAKRAARKRAVRASACQGCLVLGHQGFAAADGPVSPADVVAELAAVRARAIDPQSAVRESELLRLIGITPENSAASPLDWAHARLQNGAPIGRVTDAQGRPTGKLPLSVLRTRPFVNRKPVLGSRAARNAAAAMGFLLSYDPHVSPVQASAPEYQKRLGDLVGKARGVLGDELATRLEDYVPGFAAVEGGPFADSLNAVTLPNGSILVHKKTMEVADRLGASLAGAGSRQDVLRAWIRLTVEQAGPAAGPAVGNSRHLADSVLAEVVYHELGHALGEHGATGIILPSAADVIERRSARGVQAKETSSDLKGIELAVRSGHSPLGAASFMAALSFVELYSGQLQYDPGAGRFRPSKADHPSALDRYGRMYRTLDRMTRQQRRVYGRAGRTDGAAYMDEQQRRDFALLPTPAELEGALAQILSSVTNSPMQTEMTAMGLPARSGRIGPAARPPASGRPPIVIRPRQSGDALRPAVTGFPTDGARYLGKRQIRRVLRAAAAL
jgi:hypothetical protein